MWKKFIGFLTAASLAVVGTGTVLAADPTPVPEFTRLLYRLDLTDAETIEDIADLTAPVGAWTVETGSEGTRCLKTTDAKASLLVGDPEWQDYRAVIKYKMVQNAQYDLVSPATNSNVYNLLRVSVCPRNIDNVKDGKYCKYIYTNPPRYSGHYLEEYYYDGSNNSVRYFSTSSDFVIDRNAVQTIETINYNVGENVKFVTRVNEKNATEVQSVYHNTSSTASKGPLGLIFEDVVKGHTFADMGYAAEVYSIEIYGEKPEVVPIATRSYRANLYESDFENAADFAATGLTAPAGEWTVAEGSEGKKCLKGVMASGAASLMVGMEEWADCDVDIDYKLIQNPTAEPSQENKTITTVYTRSGDSLGSGNFIQYRFDNPAYYSNYFGGYSKDGNAALAMITDFNSGKDESAAIKMNVMQKVHVSDINHWGTNGATIEHSVEYNNGISEQPFKKSVSKWAGTGSGLLNGKVGIKFQNNSAADAVTVEIYNIKITGTKTFTLAYLNAAGEAVTELKAGDVVTVTGAMQACLIGEAECAQPIVATAVYDEDVLMALKMQNITDGFAYEIEIPSEVQNGNIKTFVWSSFGELYPIFDAVTGITAQ